MVNYCNKIFFVIFLILCPLQPVYGMESNGNMSSGNFIFKTIVNHIRAPFSYLYRKLSSMAFQKSSCIQNLEENVQIFHDTSDNKFDNEKIAIKQSSDLARYEKSFSGMPAKEFISLMAILSNLYTHKNTIIAQNNVMEKSKPIKTITTKNNNNSTNFVISYCLNKYRQYKFQIALDNARENGYLDESCNILNGYLKQGIDVNFRDTKHGRNQLHIMVEMLHKNPNKFNIRLFGKLLNRGVNSNARDNCHVSPLWAAMFAEVLIRGKRKRTDVRKFSQLALDLLIDSKANINEKKGDRVPLGWAIAIAESNIELVKKLCAAGANLTKLNQSGHNAFCMMLDATENKPLKTRISNIRILMTHTKFKNDHLIDKKLKERFMETLLIFKKRNEIPIELQAVILKYVENLEGVSGTSILISSPHFSTFNQLKNRVNKLNEVRKDEAQKSLCGLLLPLSVDSDDPAAVEELRSLVLDDNRLDRDYDELQDGILNKKFISPTNVVSEMYQNLLQEKKLLKYQ